MDNSHQEESTVNQSAEEATHEIADESSRITRHVADDSGGHAHANAEFITGQAETFRQILLSGSELASHLTARSADHFVRAIGIGAPESEGPVHQVTGTMIQSGSAVARCAQAVSAELVGLVLQRTERSLDHLDAMMRSRTPQFCYGSERSVA